MAISDPIADMLTRIRNAAKAKFNSVDIPASRMARELARVLREEGFIRNFKMVEEEATPQGVVRVYLKYDTSQAGAILGLKRISKPSRRIYTKCIRIQPVFNGMGIAILSTPKGVMTDRQARKENVGGEILCNVW